MKYQYIMTQSKLYKGKFFKSYVTEWFLLSILKIFLPALSYYSSIFKQVRKEFF